MDALDLAVYREMMRGKVMWWGASDPRLSAESIAKRLHVARSTVRARLSRMRSTGFLAGWRTIPNPGLFGCGIASASVRIDDVRAKPDVLDALRLVDGAFGVMDLVGPWIAVALVESSKAALDRQRDLIRRLPGVDEVTPCYSLRVPAPARTPSEIDWRIVRALREMPDAELARVAKAARVSTKTLGKRYAMLLRENLVWFVPRVEYAKGGAIVRFVVFVDGSDAAEATCRLLAREPDLLSFEDRREASQHRGVDVYRSLRSPAQMEDEQRRYLEMPGVVGCEPLLPRRAILFDAWVEERLAHAATAPEDL